VDLRWRSELESRVTRNGMRETGSRVAGKVVVEGQQIFLSLEGRIDLKIS
jgi:NAD-specific glutamate dehydrogenase